MELGLRKCAVAHMIRGSEEMRGSIALGSGTEIRELEEGDAYHHLGVEQSFGADLRKTKQGIEREYIGRTRRVWEPKIWVGRKVRAQNTWATAVLRYSLGTVSWVRSEVRELDRTIRKVMRQNKAHQYGASVARLYQARTVAGKGLVILEKAWETETIATALYLHSNQVSQVRDAMHYLEQVATPIKNGLVQNALENAQKYEIGDLLRVGKEGHRAQDPRSTIREIRARQRQGLGEERAGKAIHGIFQAEVDRRGCDRRATCAWMRSGRFRAETEDLIIAAQDGIIHIAAYRHGMIKDGRDPTCRECGTMMETMGHIMAACSDYKWNRYKKRHDAVLDILVGAVPERHGITIPRNRWTRSGTAMGAVYEGEMATILVDQCIPTKGHFAAIRPDLMVSIYSTKTIIILEVACAWDPNVAEREAQKKPKYRELAADLAH